MPGPHAVPFVLQKRGSGGVAAHEQDAVPFICGHEPSKSQMTLLGRSWKEVGCLGQWAFLPTPH